MFQDFLIKYNGMRDVGNTTENRGECTGLFAVYAESLGLPFTWGDAMDIFANADEKFYEKILNTPEAIPQQGDCVVWGKSFNGTFGHIALATGTATLTTFECFTQNDPLGSNCHLKTYPSYKSVIGWLRPKIATTGIDPIILAQSDAFIAICTKLNLPANRDVVLGEIDKLVGYEDKLIEKDKQLSEAQAKAQELETTIVQRDEELKKLQGEINGLKEKVDIAMVNNKEMSEEIGQLKKDCQPAIAFTGWRQFVFELLKKI